MEPNQDAEHLRLLSVFHYLLAGVLGLFSLFPIVHLAIGIAIVTGALDELENGNPPPALIGWVFVISAAVGILCGLSMATCIAFAGRQLGRRASYTYCFVVACLECVFMPIGTVLGVFTILVLMRPSVKLLFGVPESEP